MKNYKNKLHKIYESIINIFGIFFNFNKIKKIRIHKINESIVNIFNKFHNFDKLIIDKFKNNKFSKITEIDTQRKVLIKKIMDNETYKNNIKARINKLVENNNKMLLMSEKKLEILSKNHNKFNKRLKAYSFNK